MREEQADKACVRETATCVLRKVRKKKKRKVRYTPLRFHIISKGKRRNSTPGYLWGQSRG